MILRFDLIEKDAASSLAIYAIFLFSLPLILLGEFFLTRLTIVSKGALLEQTILLTATAPNPLILLTATAARSEASNLPLCWLGPTVFLGQADKGCFSLMRKVKRTPKILHCVVFKVGRPESPTPELVTTFPPQCGLFILCCIRCLFITVDFRSAGDRFAT